MFPATSHKIPCVFPREPVSKWDMYPRRPKQIEQYDGNQFRVKGQGCLEAENIVLFQVQANQIAHSTFWSVTGEQAFANRNNFCCARS